MARTFHTSWPENALAEARDYVAQTTDAIYQQRILMERLKRGDNSEEIGRAAEELAMLREALILAREYLHSLMETKSALHG
jgi:hypothetical protein